MPALRPVHIALLALALDATPAPAAWPTDPAVNLPVCTTSGTVNSLAMCSDGAGGFIVSWQDFRDYATQLTDLYMQRVSADGAPLWTADGVGINTETYATYASLLVPDGAHGAYIAWQDLRNGPLNTMVQHVDSAGARLWTPLGAAVSNAEPSTDGVSMCLDGAGGVYVAWTDHRPSSAYNNAFVQRVNSAGVMMWYSAGTSPVLGFQADSGGRVAGVVSDGAGGVFVGTSGNGNTAYGTVRLQHMSLVGTPLWGYHGLKVCGQPTVMGGARMISDGSGGVIFAWLDKRHTAAVLGTYEIYAQRLDAAGVAQWATDGVPVCLAPASATGINNLVADAAGGFAIVWVDSRAGYITDLYAQHVDGAGNATWTPTGAPVCTAAGLGYSPSIAHTTAGDWFFAWSDARNPNDQDLYAQMLRPDGSPRWAVDGIPIGSALHNQVGQAVLADDTGGAYATWIDYRLTPGFPLQDEDDLYAQRVMASGQLGTVGVEPEPAGRGLALAPASSNPSRGAVSVSLTLERESDVRVEVTDLAGRCIARLVDGIVPAGRRDFRWGGRDVRGNQAPPGLYLVSARTQGAVRTLRIVRLP